MSVHGHLKRLDTLWTQRPLFFVTVCTADRCPILNQAAVMDILLCEWRAAHLRHGWLVGRYVVMPDHVHFFCAPAPAVDAKPLAIFIARWKEWTSKQMRACNGVVAPVWQKQFFDHLLRSRESYADKWAYVRANPVRAGLVESAEQWPYAGHVDFDVPI